MRSVFVVLALVLEATSFAAIARAQPASAASTSSHGLESVGTMPALDTPSGAALGPLEILRARMHVLDRRRRAGAFLLTLGAVGWVAGTGGSVAAYEAPDCSYDSSEPSDPFSFDFCGALDFGPWPGVVATSLFTLPLVVTGGVLTGRARHERRRLLSLAPSLTTTPSQGAWIMGLRGTF